MAHQAYYNHGSRIVPGIVHYLKERKEDFNRWSRTFFEFKKAPMTVIWGEQDPIAVIAMADRVKKNTKYFRDGLASTGFEILGEEHPISPVLLGEAELSQQFSMKLLERNIYAIGFFFPVVPQGKARIRTQISAAHTKDHLDQALEAFVEVGRELGVC